MVTMIIILELGTAYLSLGVKLTIHLHLDLSLRRVELQHILVISLRTYRKFYIYHLTSLTSLYSEQ